MLAAWAIAKALPWKLIGILAIVASIVLGIWYYGSVQYAKGEAAERVVWEAKVVAERNRLEAARQVNLEREAKRALEAITTMPLIEQQRTEVNNEASALPGANSIVIPPAIARRLFLDANDNRAGAGR